MIWPFKRKPKIVDRREPCDFRAGDKVECVQDRWNEKNSNDPVVGDVLTISNITDEVNHVGVRCIWLWFRPTGNIGYNSQAFRKLVEQLASADEAFTAEMRALKPATAPRLNPARHSPGSGQVSLAEPPEHEPCGLLRDADLLGELDAADAFAGGDEQIHGVEPLVERHLRLLEDRAGADGELASGATLDASIAAVEATLFDVDALHFLAGRAGRAVRPSLRLEIGAGGFRVGEHLEQLEGADGGLAHENMLSGTHSCHVCCGRAAISDGEVGRSCVRPLCRSAVFGHVSGAGRACGAGGAEQAAAALRFKVRASRAKIGRRLLSSRQSRINFVHRGGQGSMFRGQAIAAKAILFRNEGMADFATAGVVSAAVRDPRRLAFQGLPLAGADLNRGRVGCIAGGAEFGFKLVDCVGHWTAFLTGSEARLLPIRHLLRSDKSGVKYIDHEIDARRGGL